MARGGVGPGVGCKLGSAKAAGLPTKVVRVSTRTYEKLAKLIDEARALGC